MENSIKSAFEPWLISQKADAKTALLLTIGASLLGKALGFIRLQQIAATMGASIYSDVLLVAFQLVWLVETVLVSSAVAPMVVSRLYHVDKTEGGEEAVIFFLHAAVICSGFAIVSTGFALFFSEQLTGLIAPGLDSNGRSMLISLLWISAATPLLMVLAHFLALLNRLLQNGAWYSVPQILVNSLAIAALVVGYALFDASTAAHWMMVGLGLGAFLICFVQLWAVPSSPRSRLLAGIKKDFPCTLHFRGRSSFWSGVGALTFISLVNEIYIYIDFYFASNLQVGSISLLGFASRLASMTNALIVGSAFVILEPRWAKEVAVSGERAWNKIILSDGLSIIALLSVPFAVLHVFPAELTALVYRSSEYNREAQKSIIALTQVFSFGIISLALDMITARIVVIANKQRLLLLVSFSLLPVKIALNHVLMSYYGVEGLAMATVCVVFLQAFGNAVILSTAKIPLGFQLRDGFSVLSVFIVIFITAKSIVAFLGGGVFPLLLSCLILPIIVLFLGQALGFNYSKIISRRIGLI